MQYHRTFLGFSIGVVGPCLHTLPSPIFSVQLALAAFVFSGAPIEHTSPLRAAVAGFVTTINNKRIVIFRKAPVPQFRLPSHDAQVF